MRDLTKQLVQAAGLSNRIEHALYRKTGYGYHRLKRFPAVLLDPNGYVLVRNESALSQFNVSKTHITVPNGIKSLKGYQTFGRATKLRLRAVVNTKSVKKLDTNTERVLSQGAGFGSSPEENKRIERAAIAAAAARYRRGGWSVKSRERENIGYDLDVRRASEELHIEVKGAKGGKVAFTLTRKEHGRALKDHKFVLCFVGSALRHPRMTEIPGPDLFKAFDASPIAYRMEKKLPTGY